MNVDPKQLRYRVEILQPTNQKTKTGNTKGLYASYASRYAGRENQGGTDGVHNDQNKATASVVWLVRYDASIKPSWVIRFDSEDYYVEAVTDADDGAKRYLRLSTRKRESVTLIGVAPDAPVLSSGEVTSTTVALSWTSPDGEPTAYEVYVDGVLYDTTASLTMTVDGLDPSTEYDFYVVATNAYGDSDHSNTVTETTGSGIPDYPTVASGVAWYSWQYYRYTDVAATIDALAGDSLAAWRSVGGSWGTNLATQSTSSKRPTIESDGVKSDGIDDFLALASTISLTGDFTVYVAYDCSNLSTQTIVPISRQGAGAYFDSFQVNNAGNGAYAMGESTFSQWAGNGTPGLRITRYRRSGSSVYMDTDGVAETTAGGLGNNTVTLNALLARGANGGSFTAFTNSSVRVREIVVCGANLTPGGANDVDIITMIQSLNAGVQGP